jgi:N6-L-threonylcarbamoyladenine synthase
VSGGHTDLWYRTSHTKGELIGSTRDDAAGEAFDKGAVQLGLPYPGGPALAALAEKGNESTHPFPLPLQKEKALDFSFSGLKTSLKYLLKEVGATASREDIAASYQLAICKHLVDRLTLAIDQYPDAKEIHIVGGVSANTRLRTMVSEFGKKHSIVVRWPTSLKYCTDNGAMIAAAGYFAVQEQPQILGRAFSTAATADLTTVVEKL